MTDASKLTEKQHEIFGIELQRMRTKLGEIATELGRVYSRELAGLATDAQQAVDSLRQKMESIVEQEYPGSNSLCKTYLRGNDVMDDIKRKIEQTKYLMSLPVDFVRLEQEGLLVREGDRFRTPDLNRLPEQVLHRIQFIDQQEGSTLLTLNTRGLDI